MPRLISFTNLSLDGYFADDQGDMRWAHRMDPEFQAFVEENAKGGGVLLFGRVTYDLMVQYWPTPMAAQQNPVVAERMNNLQKVVFSRTMEKATWNNTELVTDDIVGAIRKRKSGTGDDMAIMGSGSIVAQLGEAGLIDEFQVVIIPIVLGKGKTLFAGINERLNLQLLTSRSFRNGNVFLSYAPAK